MNTNKNVDLAGQAEVVQVPRASVPVNPENWLWNSFNFAKKKSGNKRHWWTEMFEIISKMSQIDLNGA